MKIQHSMKRSIQLALALSCIFIPLSSAQEKEAAKAPLPILNEPIQGPGNQKIDWPQVLMADDTTAGQQEEIIKSLGRRFDDFIKDSVNAPIDIAKDRKSADGGTFRIYSYCFAAYGTLEQLSNDNLLKNIFAGNGNNGLDKDLGKVGDDSYSFTVEPELIKRVRLETVMRSNESKGKKSVYAGSIVVDEDPGKTEKSTWAQVDNPKDKHPYLGMGVYTKATPLVAAPGALFFEVHLVFFEPEGWFDGRNLLGAKLPLMIQDQVRSLRRELAKAATEATPEESGS